MLWGIAAWRRGLLEGNPRLLDRVMILGVVIWVAALLLGNGQAATIPLAFAYGAALLRWNPHAPWIAAGGQMALTNYLTQSIVFGFVFYGYGLGRFGTMGVGVTLLAGAIFYCIQLAWSRWWLRRFRSGRSSGCGVRFRTSDGSHSCARTLRNNILIQSDREESRHGSRGKLAVSNKG